MATGDDPLVSDEPPCEICGRMADDCVCPECPKCGAAGDPRCAREHGLKQVVIWSGEHGAYWRPNRAGYTTDSADAGRYHRDDAIRIISGCGPEKKIQLVPVAALPMNEAEVLRAELATEREHSGKLAAFKQYVHDRLDGMGVPHDPDPEHNAAHGCRIEGRLNYLQKRVQKAELACAFKDLAIEGAIVADAEGRELSEDDVGYLIAAKQNHGTLLAEIPAIIGALERAAGRLDAEADQLASAGDYGAEIPSGDARMIRQALRLFRAP